MEAGRLNRFIQPSAKIQSFDFEVENLRYDKELGREMKKKMKKLGGWRRAGPMDL